MSTATVEKTEQATTRIADKMAASADSAVSTTRTAANNTLDHVAGTIESLRQRVPAGLTSVAAQVEELTQRGLERARQARQDVREQVAQAGDRTVGYIKDEPVKSVLIAAGTGAAVALLISFLARSRDSR